MSRKKIPRPKAKGRLPSDIADAAEAALDDMLASTPNPDDDDHDAIGEDDIVREDDEPKTQTRAPSHEQIVPQDDGDEEILTGGLRSNDEAPTRAVRSDTAGTATNRRSKIPLPAPPRTTSAHTVTASTRPSQPAPRGSPAPRPSPLPAAPRSSPAESARSSSGSTPPQPRGSSPSTPAPAPGAFTALTRPIPSPPSLSRPLPSPAGSTPLPRPTPPPDRDRSPIDDVISSLSRARSSPTVGETPMTRGENTTAERDSSDDIDASTELPTHASIDETGRVPDEMILDVASAPVDLPIDFGSGPITTNIGDLVPDPPELVELQVVVYEESAHLASAQSAISAAGHVVNVGAAGRDGIARVIRAIRGGGIDVALVALPGGEAIIEATLALDPRRPVVIASLACSPTDAVMRAHAAGADLAITRPHDVDRLAPLLLAAARLYAEKRVSLAARGSEQVLRARLDEISDSELGGLLPFEMFQRVLELEIKRAKRYEYPLSVALFAVEVEPPPPPAGIRGILRARAGNALINTIRDIDLATQLDHERFLVLLPYTDLKGAAGLGRRVIASVGDLDPVIAGGRSFPPRVVGAVAGGAPGQPLSFSKLMKDATRALEQARRDGAELAVQP
ncbi:MAG TPA: diguanylate cyclase [Kofleriaceae bacterium]